MTYLDDEVARVFEDTSGQYSPADLQAAESFRETMKARDTHQVLGQAADREVGLKQKQSAAYEQIRDTQKTIDAARKAQAAGDITHGEFLNISATAELKARELERKIDALESAEAVIAEMRRDPVGFQDRFFQKWVVLRDRRPSIDQFIEEDRCSRREASRRAAQKP